MAVRGTVGRLVAKYGQPCTIRRATVAAGANAWTAGAATYQFFACKARGRHFKPSEIEGAILEGDVLFVIDAASAATVPRVGDWIARGSVADVTAADEWLQIVNVYAPQEAGTVAAYRVQARE